MQPSLTPLYIASDALQVSCHRMADASRSGYGEGQGERFFRIQSLNRIGTPLHSPLSA